MAILVKNINGKSTYEHFFNVKSAIKVLEKKYGKITKLRYVTIKE